MPISEAPSNFNQNARPFATPSSDLDAQINAVKQQSEASAANAIARSKEIEKNHKENLEKLQKENVEQHEKRISEWKAKVEEKTKLLEESQAKVDQLKDKSEEQKALKAQIEKIAISLKFTQDQLSTAEKSYQSYLEISGFKKKRMYKIIYKIEQSGGIGHNKQK